MGIGKVFGIGFGGVFVVVLAMAATGIGVKPGSPVETPSAVASQPTEGASDEVSASFSVKRKEPAPIDSYATMAYSREMFPQVVQKYGAAIPAINRDRVAAAKIAALDTRCDEVVMTAITSSSTIANRRYFADCGNQTRFFFDADSIAAGYPVGMQTADDMIKDGLQDW